MTKESCQCLCTIAVGKTPKEFFRFKRPDELAAETSIYDE
jgi:hypothetical protein